MAILARLDSDRALELLHTMDFNASDATPSSPFSAHAALVRQVFEVLVEREGEAALPIIEREANFLGSKGTYPYSAVGEAASRAVSPNWAKNRDHSIQVQQSVLDQMLARYSATPHTYFGDIEFGRMLRSLS